MRAVVTRELIVIARRPALTLVVCAHIVLLAVFVLVWSRGVALLNPVLGGANLYEQQHVVELWLLVALLPWAAARCLAPDRGKSLAVACALTALRPSAFVAAKFAAVALVLSLVVIAGFPVALVAQQMSAVPVSEALFGLVPLMGLAALVSAATMAWMLLVPGRLAAWVWTTLSIGVALFIARSSTQPLGTLPFGLASALGAVALTMALASWSDGALRYADE